MHLKLLVFIAVFLLPLSALAQLGGTDVASGDSCSGTPEGSTLLTADADLDRSDVVLVCDGTNWIPANISVAVPSGAVMAFDLISCPSGWSPLATAAGRVVVGAGTYAANADADGTNSETTLTVSDIGGNSDYALDVSEMPSHAHTATVRAYSGEGLNSNPVDNVLGDDGNDRAYSGVAPDELMRDGNVLVENTGGNTAFNTMPPYLALLYCKKD